MVCRDVGFRHGAERTLHGDAIYPLQAIHGNLGESFAKFFASLQQQGPKRLLGGWGSAFWRWGGLQTVHLLQRSAPDRLPLLFILLALCLVVLLVPSDLFPLDGIDGGQPCLFSLLTLLRLADLIGVSFSW